MDENVTHDGVIAFIVCGYDIVIVGNELDDCIKDAAEANRV